MISTNPEKGPVIEGIQFKELQTFYDDRGYFREVIRNTDSFFSEGFGQWSHSFMYQGVTKAWHFHKVQTDWWYVVNGVLRVGLCDMRPESKTSGMTMDFLMGDNQMARAIKIPPGIAHGCQAIQGPVNLFYVTSHTYNPEDEIRIPFDDKRIKFNWLEGPAIR